MPSLKHVSRAACTSSREQQVLVAPSAASRIASIDGTGQVRVVDRLKELITTRGFHVAPAELEAVLQRYPGVADAAVTAVEGGYPDDARPWALV